MEAAVNAGGRRRRQMAADEGRRRALQQLAQIQLEAYAHGFERLVATQFRELSLVGIAAGGEECSAGVPSRAHGGADAQAAAQTSESFSGHAAPAKEDTATSQDGRQPECRLLDGYSGDEAALAAPAEEKQLDGEALGTAAGKGNTAEAVAATETTPAARGQTEQDGRQPQCHLQDGYSGDEAALRREAVDNVAVRVPHVPVCSVFAKVCTLEATIGKHKNQEQRAACLQASQATGIIGGVTGRSHRGPCPPVVPACSTSSAPSATTSTSRRAAQDGQRPDCLSQDGHSGGEAALACQAGGVAAAARDGLGGGHVTADGHNGEAAGGVTLGIANHKEFKGDPEESGRRSARQDGRQPLCRLDDGYSGNEAALELVSSGGEALGTAGGSGEGHIVGESGVVAVAPDSVCENQETLEEGGQAARKDAQQPQGHFDGYSGDEAALSTHDGGAAPTAGGGGGSTGGTATAADQPEPWRTRAKGLGAEAEVEAIIIELGGRMSTLTGEMTPQEREVMKSKCSTLLGDAHRLMPDAHAQCDDATGSEPALDYDIQKGSDTESL